MSKLPLFVNVGTYLVNSAKNYAGAAGGGGAHRRVSVTAAEEVDLPFAALDRHCSVRCRSVLRG